MLVTSDGISVGELRSMGLFGRVTSKTLVCEYTLIMELKRNSFRALVRDLTNSNHPSIDVDNEFPFLRCLGATNEFIGILATLS